MDAFVEKWTYRGLALFAGILTQRGDRLLRSARTVSNCPPFWDINPLLKMSISRNRGSISSEFTINLKAWIDDVFNKVEHMKPSQNHTLFPQNWRK